MSSGTATTFMTAVNLFQFAAQEQKLPSGLVERDNATGSTTSTPLTFRQSSTRKQRPSSPRTLTSSRNRTYTAPSLYAAFERSLLDDAQAETHSRAISSPETLSFTESFMPNRALPTQISKCHAHMQQPKTPISDGCILPGPARSANPFETGSVRASTASGCPAWYCRHDQLVIFDGIQTHPKSGVKTFLCRTSKGLEVARKHCPKERVYVNLTCGHCKDMLGKSKWIFEARVRQLSVCVKCRERCLREEETMMKTTRRQNDVEMKDRRDSFLTDSSIPNVEIDTISSELRKVHSDSHIRNSGNVGNNGELHAQNPLRSQVSHKEIHKSQSDQYLRRP